MRAFFADGVDKLHIPWAVEGLPALLHLSLFLFFSGLLIFLFNINHTVFGWVISCVGIFLTVYGWITVVPIFRHDSPYYSPLSGSVWLLYTGTLHAFFKVLTYLARLDCFTSLTQVCFHNLRWHYYRVTMGSVEKAAEETTSKQSSAIDLRILDWTLGTLGEDDLLENFFDAIPGFINSSLVEGLKWDHPLEVRFGWALAEFLRRTLLSNSILDSVKSHRLIICIDTVDAMDISIVFLSLLSIVEVEHYSLPQSVEAAHALVRWCNSKTSTIVLPMRCIVAGILMAVSEHDDRWIALATDQFGLPEDVLRDNVAHGDNSVLLSILIHMTRRAIHSHPDPRTFLDPWTYETLSTLSRFDIRHAVPGLQHEFCALWNEIVLEAKRQGYYSHPVLLLYKIRHAYIAIHQSTEAAPTAFSTSTYFHDDILFWPSSYPLCTLASHRSDSIPDSPHPAHVETLTLPAEEMIIAHSPTDLAITRSENASPHTQPFPYASPTTEPVHILPQAISAAYPSIPTRHMNTSVPIGVSHGFRRSTLSATETAVLADPTTYIHTAETSETSNTSVATSLTFLHPDPVLVTVTPSTPPGLPSAVLSGLAASSNARQRTTSAATLSHPQENDKECDAASLSATTYISKTSSAANTIPQFIPDGGATLERDEEATEDLHMVVSHTQSLPVPMPASRSNAVPEEVFSFIESPLIQSDSTSHTLGSPSSSATVRSRIALQPEVTSILDAHVASRIITVSQYDYTRGMDAPIPMEDLPHPNQSTAPVPAIDPVTFPPEDRTYGRN